MRIWEALQASIERHVWIAKREDGLNVVRYAYRWDATAKHWDAVTRLRPGDKWTGHWPRPTLPLGDMLIGWAWEIVEVAS